MLVHVCACVCRVHIEAGGQTQVSPSERLPTSESLSHCLEPQVGKTGWPASTGILQSLPSQYWFYKHIYLAQHFYWVLGN